MNNAQRIKAPLFVVAGLNDPRVRYTEAEQIVAAARKNGVPVWYLLADNGVRVRAEGKCRFPLLRDGTILPGAFAGTAVNTWRSGWRPDLLSG